MPPRRTGLVLLLVALALPALGAGSRDGTSPLRPWSRNASSGTADAAPSGNAPGPARTGPIEVFSEISLGGRERSRHLETLAADRRLLVMRNATFDPASQGMPDFRAFVPTLASYEDAAPRTAKHWIVQFDDALGATELAALRGAGADPLFYVPNNGYLVRMTAETVPGLWDVPGVRFVGRYLPGFKVESALGRTVRAFRQTVPQHEVHRFHDLVVLLTPGADAGDAAVDVTRGFARARVMEAVDDGGIGVLTVRGTGGDLAGLTTFLANLEDALWVTTRPTWELHNDDAVWVAQSYDTVERQNYAQSATIWNRGIQGGGQILGIVDSGVDPDTCWTIDGGGVIPASSVDPPGAVPVDLSRRKIVAYNVLRDFDGPAVAYEKLGVTHGNWAAVSMVGDDDTNLAGESVTDGSHHDTADGMAPLARLFVQDTADAAGNLHLPTIVDGVFEQMYDAGVRIANNSFSSDSTFYDVDSFFVDRMTWNHPDFLAFISAGNFGAGGDGTITGWANAKNVVAVGGTDNDGSGNPENVHSSSSRGPSGDGRQKPEVMLDFAVTSGHTDGVETGRTCGTANVTGTSFSSPLAAGAAALIREYYLDGWYPSGTETGADGFNPSAALVKSTLVNGARNMTGSLTGDTAPSNNQGYGRVMLDDALYFSGDARRLFAWDVPRENGVSTGDVWRTQFHVAGTGVGTEGMKVALVWSDPPVSPASLLIAVNDLDVRLTSPSGDEFWGNSVADRDGFAVTVEGTVPNVRKDSRLDNVEFVRVLSGDITPGMWTLDVIGTNVPGSPAVDLATRQGFAVTVTGDLSDAAGLVAFDRDRYDCDDTVTLRVADDNAGSVSVVVTTESGDSETVPLASLGAGAFESSLPTAFNDPTVTEDGTLQVVKGETLTVTYTDSAPAETSSDRAVAFCAPSLALGPGTIGAGCDGDGFLDAGEEAELTVTLVNPGPVDARNVEITLRSDSPDVFVRPLTLALGTIPPGGQATNGTPFLLSARDTVAARSDATVILEVVADGMGDVPQELAIDLVLEADEIVTAGTYTESLDFAGLNCNAPACSGDPAVSCGTDDDCSGVTATCDAGTCSASSTPCATDDDCRTCGWYYFDINGDCASTEPSWIVTTCSGNRRASLPGCASTVTGNGVGAIDHILLSPVIVTGDTGSQTLLKTLRFVETVDAEINESGSDGFDSMQVFVFTNVDGKLVETEYARLSDTLISEVQATTDFSRTFSWTVPPLPNARSFQLEFRVAIDATPDAGFPACGFFEDCTENVQWWINDVEVTYDNVEIVDDASSPCSPGCTDPAAPAGVTVTEFDAGVLTVGWDPVAGADHYDVYRDGAFLARVFAPDTIYPDPVEDDLSHTYVVRAVTESGLCESADSAQASLAGSGPCLAPPSAPSDLTVSNGETASCGLSLDWTAATSGCPGGSVEYRIYRSTDPGFTPGPQHLLATTAGTSFVDAKIATGFDNFGEPSGEEYTYVVRAVETATGTEETNLVSVPGRAGGPLAAGTWNEDGGDDFLPKMGFTTTVDYNELGAAWSRTTLSPDHQTDGIWTYWADPDPLGGGTYPALSCMGLDTPPIKLGVSGTAQMSFWINHQIEWEWDGLVVEMSVDGGAFAPIAPVGGYPGTFAQTITGSCEGLTIPPPADYINGCNYPPSQGAINGPVNPADLSDWTQYTFDLGNPGSTVVLRFNLSTDCGLTGIVMIDEIQVTDAELPQSCTDSGCLPPASFPGVTSVRDLDSSADTGVEITWGPVADWGAAGSGDYHVYRVDREIGIVSPPATTFVDNTAENNRTFRYRVQARNGGGCDLPDTNPVSLPGADCTDADPGDVTAATISVGQSGSVVLRSTAIPNAGSYRFRYANDPASARTSPTSIDSDAPEARHDVLDDGQDYYYVIEDGSSSDCAP